MGSLMWGQAHSDTLWVGQTILTEPLVASMTPSIGEAVRTARNENRMVARY